MKSINTKKGVDAKGVCPEMWMGIGVIAAVWQRAALQLTLTSLTDGVHPLGTEHKDGRAVDIRTRDIEPRRVKDLALEVKQILDPLGFDIVIEKDHIHVEYDPKAGEKAFNEGVA